MGGLILAPFQGYLVRPQWASRVVASAYDSKTPAQRRQDVANNPYSYLGVTRSGEDLDDNCSEAELLQLCIESFERILKVDAFVQSSAPTYYAYRLSETVAAATQFVQTGIVGALAVDGLVDGRVRIHENIRPERASLITEHLSRIGASSCPISLTQEMAPELRDLLAEVVDREPSLDLVVEGVRNQVWPLNQPEAAQAQTYLHGTEVFVTDGHHRCSAALASRQAHPHEAEYARTLAVLFPHDELKVTAFHRRVFDPKSRSSQELRRDLQHIGEIREIGEIGEIAGVNDTPLPQAKGEIVVYHNKSWLKLHLKPLANATTLESLDVERLRREVICGLFDIDELNSDQRVVYVAEPAGVEELVNSCDADGYVGFLLYPTDISELMAVAAAGQLMPPKSSYLSPKPPAGVFLRVLGVGATKHMQPS